MVKKKKINMVTTLFFIYCVLLVWIILFKLQFSLNSLEKIRNINLIPFYYENNVSFHFREVIENVIIFIPLGIYLKMIGIDNKKTILFGFAVSLLLEVSQYVLRVGASDITDVITNTLGALIGVLFYNISIKLFKTEEKVKKIFEILALVVTIMFLLFVGTIMIANF